MASLSDHLAGLRAKPHHVRRQIAFSTSLAITALVAIGWMGALASSPRLAVGEPGTDALAMDEARTNFTQLVGAAGAAFGASSSPAQVLVVDTKTSSTLDAPRDNYNDTKETVIPF